MDTWLTMIRKYGLNTLVRQIYPLMILSSLFSRVTTNCAKLLLEEISAPATKARYIYTNPYPRAQ